MIVIGAKYLKATVEIDVLPPRLPGRHFSGRQTLDRAFGEGLLLPDGLQEGPKRRVVTSDSGAEASVPAFDVVDVRSIALSAN